MSTYKSRQELAGKSEWEGGIDALLEYGVRLADLPEDDDELRDAWADLERAWAVFEPARDAVDSLLYEEGDE